MGTKVKLYVPWAKPWSLASVRSGVNVYKGMLIAPDPWQAPGTINILTGVSCHPVSEIRIDRISKLKILKSTKKMDAGSAVAVGPKVSDEPFTEKVASSKPGKFYSVEWDGHFFRCTCSGFGFRGTCRHVKEAAKLHEMKT